MPFCPDCHSIIYPRAEGGMECKKCGYTTEKSQSKQIVTEMKVRERVVLEKASDIRTLPTMRIECPSCGNMEAFWILRQTRHSDEPETAFLTCTKCNHKWRRY